MLTTSQTKDIHFYTTIDIQGLCDTAMSNEEVCKVLTKSIRQEVSHLNRVVIVLQHGRLDPSKSEALETLITMFDLQRKTRRYKALVIITKCDGVKKSVMEEVYDDMKKDETLSKIHYATNESIKLDNICCVWLGSQRALIIRCREERKGRHRRIKK